jgi:hypothetical protein
VGAAVGVFDEEELEIGGSMLSTLFRVLPVSTTQSAPGPPPAAVSRRENDCNAHVYVQSVVLSPLHVVSHVLFGTCHDLAGSLSPHQQFSPSDKPMTFLFSCRQTSWQLPGLWNSYRPWLSSGVGVAKQPTLTMALAGLVTVGVVIGFLMVVEGVSSAATVSSIEAAARTETNLMRTMIAVMGGSGLLKRAEGVGACPLNQQIWTVER